MKQVKVYSFKNCSTCQKSIKFLNSKKISFIEIPIVDEPPSLKELKQMLGFIEMSGGTFKNLFNSSGVQYRELNISQKLKDGMTSGQALTLLSKNGKLIKRPFLLTDKGGAVGFKEEIWKELTFLLQPGDSQN